MLRYLFTFGYETPAQHVNNSAHGWDDENSTAVWITADSEERALAWGREIAAAFVRQQYLREGAEPAYDWLLAGFSHGIEAHPTERFLPAELAQVPQVAVGVYPEFAAWM